MVPGRFTGKDCSNLAGIAQLLDFYHGAQSVKRITKLIKTSTAWIKLVNEGAETTVIRSKKKRTTLKHTG